MQLGYDGSRSKRSQKNGALLMGVKRMMKNHGDFVVILVTGSCGESLDSSAREGCAGGGCGGVRQGGRGRPNQGETGARGARPWSMTTVSSLMSSFVWCLPKIFRLDCSGSEAGRMKSGWQSILYVFFFQCSLLGHGVCLLCTLHTTLHKRVIQLLPGTCSSPRAVSIPNGATSPGT